MKSPLKSISLATAKMIGIALLALVIGGIGVSLWEATPQPLVKAHIAHATSAGVITAYETTAEVKGFLAAKLEAVEKKFQCNTDLAIESQLSRPVLKKLAANIALGNQPLEAMNSEELTALKVVMMQRYELDNSFGCRFQDAKTYIKSLV